MDIFVKSRLDAAQIKERIKLGSTGIELYLDKGDLASLSLKDNLRLCSDNFSKVSLETGDRLYGTAPTDLLDSESREYIEKVLNIRSKIPNAGFLVIHLAGGCQVLDPPYKKLKVQVKKEILEKSLATINELDPENKVIALENTFPTDWMDEKNGIISFYPIGKLSSDFNRRIRTFDTGHSGITAFTLANLSQSKKGYVFNHRTFGEIPVYMADEEVKLAEIAKKSLTKAVLAEVKKANIVNVHLNNSRGLLDGFGVTEGGDIDLKAIIEAIIKRTNATIVTEVKERKTRDYINTPNQREMIDWLVNNYHAC